MGNRDKPRSERKKKKHEPADEQREEKRTKRRERKHDLKIVQDRAKKKIKSKP